MIKRTPHRLFSRAANGPALDARVYAQELDRLATDDPVAARATNIAACRAAIELKILNDAQLVELYGAEIVMLARDPAVRPLLRPNELPSRPNQPAPAPAHPERPAPAFSSPWFVPQVLACLVIFGAVANLAQWATAANGPLHQLIDIVTDATTWASVFTAAALLLQFSWGLTVKRFLWNLVARLFRIKH